VNKAAIASSALALAILGASAPVRARAATVRVLPLPRHATIEPFASRAAMAVSRDGTIAATLSLYGYVTRTVVWPTGNRPYVLASALGPLAGFDETGAALINSDRPARLSSGGRAVPVDLASCEDFPQSSVGPALAGVLSNGALIATMQSPPMVNLDDTSGQNAPVVLHVRSRQCLNMGNGIALATAGLYSAGYVAYIANVPAPSNVVSSRERFTAMRWHERTREPLGAGVALAVNASGAAAGADAPPGTGAAYNLAPHARFWPSAGAPVELAAASPLSVGYAVDGRDRVTGMMEDARGRHYAFLWQGGTPRRLDDLVRAAGWRFECGYAFAPGGGIVGIGTYRGNAAAFEVDGL
jgi:hypothetical protein